MFERLPACTHWFDVTGVACGAKLTRRQHELRTTRDGSDGRLVTCRKCIVAIRKRIGVMADPATEAEEDYVRKLENLYWVMGQ